MRATELSIGGAWMFEPTTFPDSRGVFAAPFEGAAFRESLGFDMTVAQSNHSVSSRGVVRGVHYADTPPGQAKYVYCPRGVLLDVIVDIRTGSPTFGTRAAVRLDAVSCRAVYVAEGLGHAFMALEDETVMSYLCSTPYSPASERGLSPLDPLLDLPWPPALTPVLSEKDSAAPTFSDAAAAGILPSWEACTRWYDTLRVRQLARPPKF